MTERAPGAAGESNGAATRERILIEASRLIATQGYHGTTTREIAGAVGISQPSLFFHFPSKSAIADELYRLDIIPAVGRLEALIVGEGRPAAKLYTMVFGELTHILRSPYDLRAHLNYEVLNDPALDAYRDYMKRFDDMTRILIRSGQEIGELAGVDAWLAPQMVSSLLARAPMFSRASEVESLPREAATLVLHSLLADRGDLDRVRSEAAGLIAAYCGEL